MEDKLPGMDPRSACFSVRCMYVYLLVLRTSLSTPMLNTFTRRYIYNMCSAMVYWNHPGYGELFVGEFLAESKTEETMTSRQEKRTTVMDSQHFSTKVFQYIYI